MGPVWDLFRASLGLAVDVTRDMVKAYLEFLKRLGKWSIVLLIIFLVLVIVGSLLHTSWISGLGMAFIALIVAVWLIAAFPLVMLAQYTYEEISRIRKTAQLIAALLFWGLLLAIYFYLVPAWNYPAAIPLIFIICAVLALGFVRFGIGINPKLAIGAVVIILCMITISFYLPASRKAANTFVGWLDTKVAGMLTIPLQPSPQIPKRTNYDYVRVDGIVFFDPITAEPKVWYYKGTNGRIELFDGPGYHPQYKVELEPVTPDIVAQIKTQLKADADKISQEEKRKKQEAERIARSPKAPQKLRTASIEEIVFFDPLTAEPRIWYYKGEDGRLELFDGPGYHAQYKEKLELVTPDIVAQFDKQLKSDAERMAKEQQRRSMDAKQVVSGAREKRKPIVLVPEDVNGEVRKADQQELVRGREEFIEPEDPNRKEKDP